MRILIIGGTGLLGRVLVEAWEGDQTLAVGSQRADVRDRLQLRDLFSNYRPEYTVLAAAYTDVDGCEKDRTHALDVNLTGAINVAQVAREFGSSLMFVSTDYVFDGTKHAPYEPEDQVCPINVYGASKADAERSIREILPNCCIVRTSWLFGANGRCFPNTILDGVRNCKKLDVVNDQTGCPTFNRDLAHAIAALARTGAQGTIHVTNQGACTWYEFAFAVVCAAGLKNIGIHPVSSSQVSRAARRPTFSVLSPSSLDRYGISMRPWRETLADYFADRETASRLAESSGS